MKFGVNILNFGPGTSPPSLEGWARIAEAVGFHLVMISDHVAITPDVHSRYPAPFYDPFITLGWLAGITSRVELGTTAAHHAQLASELLVQGREQQAADAQA